MDGPRTALLVIGAAVLGVAIGFAVTRVSAEGEPAGPPTGISTTSVVVDGVAAAGSVPDLRPAPTRTTTTPVSEPGTPEFGTPEPVTPEPVTPEPVTPEPVTPEPVTPEPVTPEGGTTISE